MKYLKFLMKLSILSALILACDLGVGSSGDSDGNDISYYSKKVDFSTYVDADNFDLQPVESRIYDDQGKLTIIYKYFYSDQEDSGYYANDRTEVYEIDEDGNAVLAEYYKYQYQKDDYEYWDDDDVLQPDGFDYILNRGETYNPQDTLVLYYDVVYDTSSATAYDPYLSIIDYEADPLKEVARQESTYITDGYGEERYRTEKFYNLADSSDASVSLAKEFASWYDDAEPYDYLYELYHSIRSDDGSDEYYYFTQYSRNDDGNVYEQADFFYDDEDPLGPIPKDPDNSYTVDGALAEPFAYNILFSAIGSKATVLNTEYDSLGNIIKDVRSLNGQVSEIVNYTYNSNSELIDQSRYTRGGNLLYDRICIQYRDEYRDGIYYRVEEESTYKYHDYGIAKSMRTAPAVASQPVHTSSRMDINHRYR